MAVDTSAIEEAIRLDLGRRREPSTVKSYIWFARKFCRYTHKTQGFTRLDCLKYIDHLIEQGRAPNTIIWTYNAMRRVLRCIGEESPISMDDMPRGIRRKVGIGPTLSHERIAKLISYARRKGTPTEQFFLAMSTVYGLRQSELARLIPTSFSPTLSTVQIDTLKHGEPRTHSVPDEIKSAIRLAIDCKALGYSPATANKVFRELYAKSGMKRDKGTGWHSIRRALDTALLRDGVPYHIVRNFLRWVQSSHDMPGVYFHMNPSEVDREVFAKHPFLALWRQ